MHGYEISELIGRNLSIFHNEGEMDRVNQLNQQLRETGSYVSEEVWHTRRDGTDFCILMNGTLIKDEHGEPQFMAATAVDITESKKREQELTTYREHMARAEQLASLGTLSATIAHQITQPLTVIRLSLDNVVDELEGSSCSSTVLRRLRDSVTQVSNITSIINQFRSFARQSSDTVFGEVNVHAVVVRIARLLDESAKQVRVALRVEDMRSLPPVLLHEREFEQILFALVENAIQAADGKKVRQIVISGAVKEGRIELRFSDTCGGIPPENLGKIFEPFFTTKPRGLGTGLGLCIVKDAIARIGGRVRVESQYGKGSTFFLTLPMSED
jgi:PAS domain S-box-containing protein